MKIRKTTLLGAGLLAVSLGSVASAHTLTGMPETTQSARMTPLIDASLDDMGHPITRPVGQSVLIEHPSEADTLVISSRDEVGPLSVNTTLEVELITDAPAAALQLARLATDAWAAGDDAAATRYLDQLTEQDFLVGTGYSYHTPVMSFRSTTETRIGGTRTNNDSSELEFDPVSGNLYALNNWGSNWTVSVSTDNGNSWAVTYAWNTTGLVVDVDMAVTGGYVYVAYVDTTSSNQVRLRRMNLSGVSDLGYAFKTVHTTGVLSSIVDVEVDGNVDSAGNRVYIASIDSSNDLAFYWANSFNGVTFNDVSPNVVNAESDLDVHWNQDAQDYSILLAYRSTTNGVVFGRLDLSWDFQTLSTSPTAGRPISLSAYQDTVLISFGKSRISGATGIGAGYEISYNGGDDFLPNGVSFGNENDPNLHFGMQSTARLGYGVALAEASEEGLFDPIRLRHRSTYSPGFWSATQLVNTLDTLTGPDVIIQAIPTVSSAATYAYGIVHEADAGGFTIAPHFIRVEDCAWRGDINGDGTVDITDLLSLLAVFDTANIANDITGDGFADISDLLILLSEYENSCVGF